MPQVFAVFHNPNFTQHFRRKVLLKDCTQICVVEVPDFISDLSDALEFVYQKTNSLEHPFWDNHEVTLIGGLTKARSLSAGDVVLTPLREAWLCAASGWIPLTQHNMELPLALARHDAVLADNFLIMGHSPMITWPIGPPSEDTRWTKSTYYFSKEFLIGSYPEGKTRQGYYWREVECGPRCVIYWPDTGKYWVILDGKLEEPLAVFSDMAQAQLLVTD